MQFTVNGKKEHMPGSLSISALLKHRDVDKPETVAVELNDEIVNRPDFDATVINEKDRVERVCENTMKMAEFLEKHPKVKTVFYPGLPTSASHESARKQFGNRYGGVLSFELEDKSACFTFLDKLNIIKRASNLGDNTSLIIHPASTISGEYSRSEKEAMGVGESLIRLSMGIEDIADIIADIKNALAVL